MRILIGATDEHFVTELAAGLGRYGFDVDSASDGAAVLERCATAHAVLVDLVLDDIDGFEVLRAVRAVSTVPMIVVSRRTDEMDRVLAFKLGADDYVVRPYSLRELTARIEAAIRRGGAAWLPQPPAQSTSSREVGDLRVDVHRRMVVIGSRPITLTRKEFDILALLISDPGRVFSREDIMLAVWGHDGAGDTRTLGVHISGLRRRLGSPDLIETVRGVGFRLATDDAEPVVDALPHEEAV